jgi:hypothetical protein
MRPVLLLQLFELAHLERCYASYNLMPAVRNRLFSILPSAFQDASYRIPLNLFLDSFFQQSYDLASLPVAP